MEKVTTRGDRIAGYALLLLSIAIAFMPRLEIAAQPIAQWLTASPWMFAAILLLTMDSAARPNPKLIRWGAAILFVMGLAGPFIANLIDSSLGA